MITELTPEMKEWNKELHKNHKELMLEAFDLWCKHAKRYDGGIYGFDYEGRFAFSKDTYDLARIFEIYYAELNGIK